MTNISTFENLAEYLQVLGQPARLQILLAISDAEPCVCHLEAVLGWRQSYLSQHLMALRKAGLVGVRRVGRNIHYHLVQPELLAVIGNIASLQGIELPHLSPSDDCHCPNCRKAREPG